MMRYLCVGVLVFWCAFPVSGASARSMNDCQNEYDSCSAEARHLNGAEWSKAKQLCESNRSSCQRVSRMDSMNGSDKNTWTNEQKSKACPEGFVWRQPVVGKGGCYRASR